MDKTAEISHKKNTICFYFRNGLNTKKTALTRCRMKAVFSVARSRIMPCSPNSWPAAKGCPAHDLLNTVLCCAFASQTDTHFQNRASVNNAKIKRIQGSALRWARCRICAPSYRRISGCTVSSPFWGICAIKWSDK